MIKLNTQQQIVNGAGRLTHQGYLVLRDLERRLEGASTGVLEGVRAYASRSDAQNADVPASQWAISIYHAGHWLNYIRDPNGTALITGDGARWSPAGAQSPLHWGGLCNGVADDADAWDGLSAWVNDLGSADVILNGLSLSSRPIQFTVSDLRISCEPGVGGLYFPDSDGISLVQNRRYATFHTSNLLLITGAQGTRTGWFYENTATATGDTAPREHDHMIAIGMDRWNAGKNGQASPQYTQGWLYDCDMINADRVRFSSPWLQGPEQDRFDGFPIQTAGIRANGTTHIVVEDPQIYLRHTGIIQRGLGENLEVKGGALVANKRGIDFYTDTPPANDHNITGTHISSYEFNINLGSGGTVTTAMHNVSHCLLFCRNEPTRTESDFTHVKVKGQAQIDGNYFFTGDSVDPSLHRAVVLEDGKASQVMGNIFTRIGTPVQVEASASHTVISENVTNDDGVTLLLPTVSDSGTNTRIGINYGDRDWKGTALVSRVWSRADPISFQVGQTQNFSVSGAVGAVNYLDVIGAATGAAPEVRAHGADADIDLSLAPKGAGYVKIGAPLVASSDAPVVGYVEVKDSTGAVVKLAVIS